MTTMFMPTMIWDETILVQRVRADQLSGWQRRLQVPEETCALVFEYGVPQREVGTGEYTLDSLLARINRLGEDAHAEAVLVRLSVWTLPIDLVIHTVAGEMALTVELTVRVESSQTLVAALLAGRDTLYQADVVDLLRPSVQHDVGLAMAMCSTPSPDMTQLNDRLQKQLALTMLPRWGLAQLGVQVNSGVQRVDASDEAALRQRQTQERLQLEHEETLADRRLEGHLGRDGRSLDHQLQAQRKTGTVDRQERVDEAQAEAEISTIQIGTEAQQLEIQLHRQKIQQQHLQFLVNLDQQIDDAER